MVIDVFAIECVVFRVKVEGLGVMASFGVCAPHISGGGMFGSLGGYLVFLRGVCANELPLFREEGWVIWQWTGSV